MIARRIVLKLGLSQFISWGVYYYLIGVFGDSMAADLGWSRELIHGGFALALLVMGLTSPLVGRLIDHHGGPRVMVAGSLLGTAGCLLLAFCHTLSVYCAAWLCLGVAMRLTLYDAAFAALARIGGRRARRAMSQITLPGGLASTIFWPFGAFLAQELGWRGAVMIYAGFAFLTIPLHFGITDARQIEEDPRSEMEDGEPRLTSRRDLVLAGGLYMVIVTAGNFLNAGMSAHMISILAGLGLAASSAVWVAAMRGIGQSSARLGEILFGKRMQPLTLNLLAALLLPLGFMAAFAAGSSLPAAVTFAAAYGAGNGLLTIARGTVPLALFDSRSYGALLGYLLVPGFILSAAAPVIYARIIGWSGEAGALYLSLALAMVTLIAAAALRLCFHGDDAP
jgi:predicted MFS family arabinose efflux permease